MATPISKIEIAHKMYRDGFHSEALNLYTEALATAKTKAQKIALHSNRAACYLKLHDFDKAAEECTSVLELDRNHTGALMLRSQTLVTLKDYQSALFDVNRLIELDPSSDVYRNLQARLKTQLALAPIPESEEESQYLEEEKEKSQQPKQAETKIASKEESKQSNQPSMNSKPPVIQNNATIVQSKSQEVPKPKGHSKLDYSRWDKVEDDSSDDEDDDDDEVQQPQYRFRVRTVGVRPVK